METLSIELKNFIENFCKKQKIKNIDLRKLDLNTSIDLDLNLFDIEVDLFLTEFIKEFQIDYSKFDWKKYGYPSGSILVFIIRLFFNYKKKWVKKLANLVYKPKIKISVLQNAIITGKLL